MIERGPIDVLPVLFGDDERQHLHPAAAPLHAALAIIQKLGHEDAEHQAFDRDAVPVQHLSLPEQGTRHLGNEGRGIRQLFRFMRQMQAEGALALMDRDEADGRILPFGQQLADPFVVECTGRYLGRGIGSRNRHGILWQGRGQPRGRQHHPGPQRQTHTRGTEPVDDAHEIPLR